MRRKEPHVKISSGYFRFLSKSLSVRAGLHRSMRKFSLIFFLVSSVSPGCSQLHFGIAGGVNLGSINTKWTSTENPDINPRFGYSLGLGTEIGVATRWAILADLNLVSKNYSIDPDSYGDETKGFDRYNILYLDLPIRVSYMYKNVRFFAGPFIDYCLTGTNKFNLQYADSTIDAGSYKIISGREFNIGEIAYDEIPINYLDGGFLFGIGYRCEQYCLDLSYSWGLVNMYPNIIGGPERNEMVTRSRLLTLNLFFYL